MEGYNEVKEIVAFYFDSFCECPNSCVCLLSFLFPFFLIYICFYNPYKRKMRIDRRNKLLTTYNTGLIPCCKLGPITYDLNNIERIKIFVYSTPDPKVAFNKLYFITGEIYISKEKKDLLFGDVRYDKETFDRYVQFFKNSCETEIIPIEEAQDKSTYNKDFELNNFNMNSYDYPKKI